MPFDTDAKTGQILTLFEQIGAVPRCSGHEEKIGEWLQSWASEHGLPAFVDPVGNVIITVLASPGAENAPGVILQGHQDMVCEKTPTSPHNFAQDPIQVRQEGDWLQAVDTTLGADNGIALAIALTLATDPEVVHPPLELLFTVDEEEGLKGAIQLQPDLLKGKILVNLDSEREGVFTIGCAGGQSALIDLPLAFSPLPEGVQVYRLTVGGFQGGHSGIDIHKHRGNAIKLLARALNLLHFGEEGLRLVDLQGGTASNVIPRQAWAEVALLPEGLPVAQKELQALEKTVKAEYAGVEENFFIHFEAIQSSSGRALSPADSERVILLLQALPHGVMDYSARVKGAVETSTNLAIAKFQEETLHVLTNTRSFLLSRLDAYTDQVLALGALVGAATGTNRRYVPWQPNPASPLLAHSQALYHRLFDKDPHVEVIHAGLECGIIGSKYPEMDMISLGPNIENPHSPNERLFIPSIYQIWRFLAGLLESYTRG